jgi:hypothetical protein
MLDRVLTIDPRLPVALHWRGLMYAFAGDIASAERLLKRSAEVKLAFAGMGLSMIAVSKGQIDEAVDELAAGFRPIQLDLSDAELRVLARGIVSGNAARSAALALIDEHQRRSPTSDGVIAYALLRLGEPARALAITQDHAG